MSLHDFNVRIREEGGRLPGQAAQHRNAQAHIAGVEHRDLLGRLVNQRFFLRGVAGGADHRPQAMGLGIGQHIRHGAMVGKVNHHIRLHRGQVGKGPVVPITAPRPWALA